MHMMKLSIFTLLGVSCNAFQATTPVKFTPKLQIVPMLSMTNQSASQNTKSEGLRMTRNQSPRKSSSLSSSVEGDFDPEALSRSKEEVEKGSLKAYARAFYKFCRPHTIRGTILASIAGTTRALLDTPGAIGEYLNGQSCDRQLVYLVCSRKEQRSVISH
jgi:hypothetical protein